MDDTTTNNRRQLYRFEPPPVWAPIFSVICAGKRCTAEQVIDVNLKGVRVVFAATALPTLVTGQEITTSIQAPGLDGCVDIRGRIVFSATRAANLMVAIAFIECPDLDDRVTADFFSVFNRREDLRQMFSAAGDTLSALILNASGEADGVIDLMLRDRSHKGFGFVVDEHTDAFMQDHFGASVALHLPDQQTAVGPAQVRRRDARDDAVHYGCTFERTPDSA